MYQTKRILVKHHGLWVQGTVTDEGGIRLDSGGAYRIPAVSDGTIERAFAITIPTRRKGSTMIDYKPLRDFVLIRVTDRIRSRGGVALPEISKEGKENIVIAVGG